PVEIWSETWPQVLGSLLIDPEQASLSLIGRYYPEQGGLLALESSAGDHWFRVQGEARDVLDLYISLARTGALPEHPTRIAAALAAWELLDRPMPYRVTIDGRELDPRDIERFWSLMAASELGELLPSEFGSAS